MPRSLNNKTLKNQKAISLIEMLMTLVIFVFVAGALYGVLISANKTWVVFENNNALGREARGVYAFLSRELREARGVFITTKDEALTLSFTKPQKGIVSYFWSAQGSQANRILRRSEKETKVLAEHVSDFSVERLPRAVKFEIEMTKKPNAGPQARVRLKGKVGLRL